MPTAPIGHYVTLHTHASVVWGIVTMIQSVRTLLFVGLTIVRMDQQAWTVAIYIKVVQYHEKDNTILPIIYHFKECGGVMTRNQGMFASPNYPAYYSGSMDCEWTFRFNNTHKYNIC